jgi:hypothetical protein
MQRSKIIDTAVLLLLFGTITLGHAQQEQKDEKQNRPEKQAEPAQQRDRQQEQRPAPQQHAQQQVQRPAPQQHAQQQEQRPVPQQHVAQQQQDRNSQQRTVRQSNPPAQQQRSQQQQIAQQGEQRGDWQQRRAHSFDTEHRTWQQRGGYSGYRIPNVYFSTYYGSGHSFRVYGQPFMEVGGFPRFQYGGYWFSVVDPYPEFWGDDWYQTDNIYVVYTDNGYLSI